MTRLRYNGLDGALGGSLTSSATSVTFAAALTHSGGTNVPTITGTDYIPLSILDSTGNLSEIVYLTAYTAAATTGTISRGQEGTTGVTHASGDKVVHGPTVVDHAVVAFKPADETVTSSTTLQSDDDLVVSIGANEVWRVEYHLYLSCAAASVGFKGQVQGPSGATIRFGALGQASTATTTEGDVHGQSHTTGNIQVGVQASSSSEAFAIFTGTVENSSTAGSIVLAWSQQNSSASGMVLKRGSSLVAHRVK